MPATGELCTGVQHAVRRTKAAVRQCAVVFMRLLPSHTQVLYFTPARVNGSWDRQRAAFTVPHAALPFFADSAWRLDPGRTGLPASAAGGAAGGGAMPYDLAAVHAGDRSTAVGEVVLPPMPPPHTPGRAAAEAAAAAALPRLLPPRAAASLPPAVLHFVLFAPPPGQRPLVLLGPDGQAAPANSFHVPGWGMLQVRAVGGRGDVQASWRAGVMVCVQDGGETAHWPTLARLCVQRLCGVWQLGILLPHTTRHMPHPRQPLPAGAAGAEPGAAAGRHDGSGQHRQHGSERGVRTD